ncbi:MAG TPA: sulfate ABC transporter substrate-binding protein, partial [Blastocatellia bacterium]|nr:sulfate ABC transporter substrate-binding protein [Blastocatellia bacterium]
MTRALEQLKTILNRKPHWKGRHNNLSVIALLVILVLVGFSAGCPKPRETQKDKATITVYGFSVVKEPLEREIFPAFQKQWFDKTGQELTFASSFAGSEMVTNQILSGVKADLAILSIDRDGDRLLKGGATKSNWHDLPHKGIVNKTPFVIVVRKGNPKGIRDFEDLAKPGIKVLHPDPISSGGAQWSLLAIYGSELVKSEKQTSKRDDAKALDLLKRIWKNVIATPGSAREARTQFETGFGDVLISYELEALQLQDKQAPFEIVVPKSTIFSEHPVVIIDRDMSPEKRALVENFINYLWSEQAQKAWVKYHFRA